MRIKWTLSHLQICHYLAESLKRTLLRLRFVIVVIINEELSFIQLYVDYHHRPIIGFNLFIKE